MRGLVQILAGQFEGARLGLHREDAQAQDVAKIAQASQLIEPTPPEPPATKPPIEAVA